VSNINATPRCYKTEIEEHYGYEFKKNM
jgi:hypothetical protein